MCPGCDEPLDQCRCGKTAAAKGSGNVRVGRETKGRKGKGVTVVTGLPLDAMDLAALAKELKSQCGAGGTTRDGVIEIQGDHRDRLVAALQTRGYAVKKSGG
jgi:translation initiation factor 1